MYKNYVFSGFGYSSGKFKVTNSDIYDALKKGFFEGFSEDKILNSEKFKLYKEQHSQENAFDYFAGHIMGFYERHHVRPFPPRQSRRMDLESTLELGVKAVRKAMTDAKIQAKDIDAWFVSTVSPFQQAPGIAASIKSFFTDAENKKPAFTLTSGCAGFNINLQKCIEYLTIHDEAKYAVVAHTETMSSFLNKRTKFVPFVTFGDAAAAVIVEKIPASEKFGVMGICNHQDLKMLDYVGVDDDFNLYMDDSVIKNRACINIPKSSLECLNMVGWTTDQIDIFIPHQTGNVILYPSAKNLNISEEKVYKDSQNLFGNTSGATVPLSLALLANKNKFYDGMKLLSATAGVGGNYGAFTYLYKKIEKKAEPYSLHANELNGKNILVLGASGKLGLRVVEKLKERSASLYLQANKNAEALLPFNPKKIYTCDFNNENSLTNFISDLRDSVKFDYVLNLAESLKNDAMQVNMLAPIQILNGIIGKITDRIVMIGTGAEDLSFDNNFSEWTSSKRAFHGYLSSASGEFFKYGIKTTYLHLGFLEDGIVNDIPEKLVFKFMVNSRQEKRLDLDTIAELITDSLYVPKQLGVVYSYENAMLVGRVGYESHKID